MPKIAICGPGRAGKDVAAEWFVANCGLRYWGSTSRVILPYAAQRLGVSVDEAWSRRHEDRCLWFDIGNELRRTDRAFLARCVLQGGDLAVGIRDRDEIEVAISEGLVDLALWIDRDVPADLTLKYGPEVCDMIVQNREGLAEFQRKLSRIAAAWGILCAAK